MVSTGWEIIGILFMALSGYFACTNNMVMAEYDLLWAILCIILSKTNK